MRAAWCLVVLILGCARTFPLCRDEACVLAELVDAGSAPPARDGGFAAQVAYLKSQNTEAGDAFGEALALSGDGNTLAVGAPGEDSRSQGNPFDNRASASGAVSVFVRREGVWTPQAFLKAATPRQGDHFGHRLALSRDGNTLAVGAVDESSDSVGIDLPQVNARAPSSGAVFVFTRTGRTWEQTAYLKASNTGAADAFGAALSLSADGTVLVVGAPGEASDAVGPGGNQFNDRAPARGAVYVFRRELKWAQTGYLKSRSADVTGFGFSLALSANASTLVVQSAGDAGVIVAVGMAMLDEQGSTQTQKGFASAAIDADGGLVASSEFADVFGRVTLYQRGPPWRVDESLPVPAGPEFGAALAMSADGQVLVVGHPGDASRATGVDGDQSDTSRPRSGAVRVFVRRRGVMEPHAYVKPVNTGAGDAFGSSVGLSDDGTVLVVGAPGEASAAVGVGGTPFNDSAPGAGAVYSFSLER
ncbi:MAG: hypothetical protein Q8L14_13815 [Myxococcales bacterium]|nr:hypothetical protein [Myxococcales bacterium]